MSVRLQFNTGVEQPAGEGSSRRRPLALLGCTGLLVGLIFLLWVNIGFAQYALTGIFWRQTEGKVISSLTTSTPIIQFNAANGVSYVFEEDYYWLCGRRSLCFIRDFAPEQVVPVVYNPRAPYRVFVYDWALFANVITWLAEAVGTITVAATLALLLARPRDR
jgi:hypothetical protein